MTLLTPSEFLGTLSELWRHRGCFGCLPHFPGTKAHGATFWLGREKAVLLLTIRGKWADIFGSVFFTKLVISCCMIVNLYFLKMVVPLLNRRNKKLLPTDSPRYTIHLKIYDRFLKHGILHIHNRPWV